MATKPARIWLGTIPYSADDGLHHRLDCLVGHGLTYSKGQRETGHTTGYDHWQLIIYLSKPQRLSWLKKEISSVGHWEPSRSEAADAYVWKDDTSVPDTRFEFGTKALKRNDSKGNCTLTLIYI